MMVKISSQRTQLYHKNKQTGRKIFWIFYVFVKADSVTLSTEKNVSKDHFFFFGKYRVITAIFSIWTFIFLFEYSS